MNWKAFYAEPWRRHSERRDEICGCVPFAAPWTLEPMGPAVSGSTAPSSGDGPLAGMVVVKAGRRVQGPGAGYLLSLLGAEVISIEPTGGDSLCGMPPMAGDCSARFLALNPRLVSAHASSWGDVRGTHPPRGTDFMVQAYAGLPDHLRRLGRHLPGR
ncbi:MAG: CoA transferase [Pseudonocardiaceae bacterium]